MANTFQLEIITPTQIFTERQVNYVGAESPDGQFGIMAKHTPATIALGIGEIKVVKDGKETFYATNGGFADIQKESVLLLVETAEKVLYNTYSEIYSTRNINKDRFEKTLSYYGTHPEELEQIYSKALNDLIQESATLNP